MTREEFRDYVEILRSQDEISYDVYSGLIDGIDTLEPEPCSGAIRIDRNLALSDDGLCEFHMYSDYAKMLNYLKSIPPTIIEADRSEEE